MKPLNRIPLKDITITVSSFYYSLLAILWPQHPNLLPAAMPQGN